MKISIVIGANCIYNCIAEATNSWHSSTAT